MKKYMVVMSWNEDGQEKQSASFFDDMSKADNYFSIGTTSLGYYGEVYEYQEATPENDFESGYQFLYC